MVLVGGATDEYVLDGVWMLDLFAADWRQVSRSLSPSLLNLS
jgi:hypothetical protein